MLYLYSYEGELPPPGDLRQMLGNAAGDIRRPESLVWRLLLRQALADLAVPGDAAEMLARIRSSENGKPFAPCAGLDFNPTHTKGLVALAIGDCGPIGLDAEAPGGRDVLRLIRAADRWFTPEESRCIRKAAENDPQSAEEVFLRIWTAKEALVKRSGAGLAGMRQADTRSPGCSVQTFTHSSCILSVATAKPEPLPQFRRLIL